MCTFCLSGAHVRHLVAEAVHLACLGMFQDSVMLSVLFTSAPRNSSKLMWDYPKDSGHVLVCCRKPSPLHLCISVPSNAAAQSQHLIKTSQLSPAVLAILNLQLQEPKPSPTLHADMLHITGSLAFTAAHLIRTAH